MPEDDDLVMESTTDTPEQIADGLGVEPEADAEPAEDVADGDVADEGEASADESAEEAAVEPTAETDDEEQAEEAPAAEVTAHPHRASAPKKGPRPQRKSVDGAAAAARRKASGEAERLKEENEQLRAQLATRMSADGRTEVHPTVARRLGAVAPVVVHPEDIPEDHPRLKAIDDKIAALGAKPKQEDFDDFDKFEEAKDAWTENRAVYKARRLSVRDEVARDESALQTDAKAKAADVASMYDRSVAAAKARHADYDTLMATAKAEGRQVTGYMSTAIMEAGELGAEILVWLLRNPVENERIKQLTPHRQIAEVGIIEGRLQASLKSGRRGPKAVETPQSPGARVTRAPEPQKHRIGDLPGKGRAVDLNDPDLPYADYKRLRDEQNRAEGRSTH